MRGLAGQTMAIDGIAGGVTDVIVRIERMDGTSQVEHLLPQRPEFVIQGTTGNWQVAGSYLVLGIEHILGGIDHLLFVLALLLIVRGARRIILTITAFTVAHSITLVAATLGWVTVPGPPVEAIIALSIVFVAAEAVHGLQGRPGLTARAAWVVAFSFGLLHGFGFAGALAEVGLPQKAIPVALLMFNVGVEIGQLLFVTFLLGACLLGQVRSVAALDSQSAALCHRHVAMSGNKRIGAFGRDSPVSLHTDCRPLAYKHVNGTIQSAARPNMQPFGCDCELKVEKRVLEQSSDHTRARAHRSFPVLALQPDWGSARAVYSAQVVVLLILLLRGQLERRTGYKP